MTLRDAYPLLRGQYGSARGVEINGVRFVEIGGVMRVTEEEAVRMARTLGPTRMETLARALADCLSVFECEELAQALLGEARGRQQPDSTASSQFMAGG